MNFAGPQLESVLAHVRRGMIAAHVYLAGLPFHAEAYGGEDSFPATPRSSGGCASPGLPAWGRVPG